MTIKTHKRKRGIALLELVIVLGIVGLVTAAIWAAASTVRDNESIHDTVQVLSDISSRVRSLYTGFPGAATPGSLSAEISRGFYPESVVNSSGNGTVNAWGGTYDVVFDGATAGTGFSIEVIIPTSVPASERRNICLGLLTRLLGSATNYIDNGGGTSGTLPTSTVPYEPTQGMGPALTFARVGGSWRHTTNDTVTNITSAIAGGSGCTGVAFYYKM